MASTTLVPTVPGIDACPGPYQPQYRRPQQLTLAGTRAATFNGEVIVKNPSDFVGAVLGASEANTKAILDNAVGKAYMLYQGGSDSGGSLNQFKTTVIDTMVAEIQSVPGEDRCVLMLGYMDQMLDMFQDYEDEELLAMFEGVIARTFQGRMKVKDGVGGLYGRIAIRRLARHRGTPGFGNACDVQTMFDRVRGWQADRLNKTRRVGGRADDFLFTAEDLIGPDLSQAAQPCLRRRSVPATDQRTYWILAPRTPGSHSGTPQAHGSSRRLPLVTSYP
ncbi:hypothetical protein HYPSUDRAFT_204408 [Hypholoma sublateritium FD-334 SS-4]|uniref:Uncharacterized protein n=1 Tax=Hypholoma sublateritium (strain FD-334 SS-4) TaxID=945553 RepID=A0A0D2PI06_HYPSF|nr:hypothetical protein HYPSUDRAFT_204408 [Hypholoma sublateritium FD-334 SS-4]